MKRQRELRSFRQHIRVTICLGLFVLMAIHLSQERVTAASTSGNAKKQTVHTQPSTGATSASKIDRKARRDDARRRRTAERDFFESNSKKPFETITKFPTDV